ncbi:hypothetical protein BC830DRAFT_1164628 [Chytriomyces sp. MP71]|nr:hypothetical protein BC830DRAFT_1164628 [Chytriomyces sp. MP71]
MSAGMSPKAACVSSVAPNGSNTKTRKNNIQCAESVVDYSDPNAFSIKGLPLDHILKLITSWGGARKLKNKTTAQVNAEFLQPLTKSTGLSLCAQYITSDDPSLKYVSKDAKFFISHAWSFQFLDVMDALITFFKENRLAMSEIVWLDLFSNSQWNTASKPFEWWQNTFMNAVKRIGNVVLILEPWSAPLPLTRAWCIFEIYACVATRSLFHVAMTPKQRDKFMTTLRNEPDRFHGILANTSCERSEAFKPSDKESIFSVIRATIGFTKLDQMVFSTFANWTEEQMKQRIADTARNEIESTDWQCALAGFYKLQGKLYQAEVIYRRCLEMHTYIFGEKHEDTLVTLNDLATLLFSAGKFQDAEPLYARCLDIQKEHLGHSHPYTIGTISNLAGLFISQRRYSEAELLYHSILEVAEKEFGAEDPITLAAEGNLAYLYVQLGRLQEAETIFVKCIASNAKKHGIDHPYTLGVMCSLADLFQKQNRHKAAVDLYSECLSGYSRVLGNEHPTTVAIKHVITKTQ